MNDEQCPVCGLHYRDFRTGLCFGDVFGMLWVSSDDRSLWKHKRRNTVLGLWRAVKIDRWQAHVAECVWAEETADEIEDLEADDFIPF